MDVEGLLYRIINGYYYIYVNKKRYKIMLPSLDIKQQAHAVYIDIINSNRFDVSHWMTQDQAKKILAANDIWNDDKENELKILTNRLDDMKIELYLKYNDPTMKKKIKASLDTGKEKISELLNSKHSMDSVTLENHANSIKNEYILVETIYNDSNELVFSHDNTDSRRLEDFLCAMTHETITNEKLRAVARSDIWKGYWDSAKENVFAPPAYLWTDEQRLLINISKMYDSIREHPQCPEDAVIEDDDALDGFIIFYKRKAEKDRKKDKLMEGIGGKYKNAGEVFIVTNSVEEAKEIYSLNDAKGMAEIQHMRKMAADNKTGEGIPWQELPHVKMELENKFKQKQSAMMKGK